MTISTTSASAAPAVESVESVPTRPGPGPGLLRGITALTVLAGLVAVVDLHFPVVREVAGSYLLVLPAVLVANKVDWHMRPGLVRTIHAAGTVVLAMILGGLAVNTLGRLLGFGEPLSAFVTVPLVTATDVAVLHWRRERHVPLRLGRRLGWTVRPLTRADLPGVLGAVAVVLAVLGAVRLNNGVGPSLAVAAMVAVGASFVFALTQRAGIAASRDVWTVYLVSLALLFGTSLRGWYITGHDIQREYIVYNITHTSNVWDMSAYPNPFNACLSITILPTIVTDVTGLSGLLVFKVLAPMLFASVPALVYVLGARLVSRRLALLGALFVVSFPTFFTDMPFLVRQQVAFLFLALLVLLAGHAPWSARARMNGALVMGSGVVLSHYSTTFLFAGTLLLALAVRFAIGLARRRTAAPPGAHVLVTVPFAVAIAAMSVLWTGPATHTGGHFEEVVSGTVGSLVDGTTAASSSDVKYGLFAGQPEPAQQRLNAYSDEVLKASARGRAEGALLPVSRADQHPRAIPHETAPPTVIGRAVEKIGLDPVSLVATSRDAVAKVVQVLLLVGTAGVALGTVLTRRFSADLRCLTIATTVAIVLLVLAPGLSADYGVLRAFQQALLVVAPTVALGLVMLCRVFGRYAAGVVNAAAVLIFGVLVALLPFAVGGYQPPLNLADDGLYYDLYYSSPEEVAGIRWLDRAVSDDPVQSEVVTDRYNVGKIAALRGTSAGTNDEFFPTLLRRDSYVYAGATTVRLQRAAVFFSGDLLEYRYPVRVLDDGKDRVYDNGYARIYR